MYQPGEVSPGDTIWIHGGTYPGGVNSRLTGTPTNPIIVRNFNSERVSIVSSDATTAPFTANGSYTWYWGLELTMSTQETDVPGPAGVNVFGDSNKFINCVSHDNLGAGFVDQNSANTELYGNLAYFNGRRALIPPDHVTHDYGVYGQSSNGYGHKYYTDNFFLDNYGNYQIHIYAEQGLIDSFRIAHNVVYSYPSESILMVNGGHDNWVDSNFVFGSEKDPAVAALYVQTDWNERDVATNIKVRGNYFMYGRCLFSSGSTRLFIGNTSYGETPRVDDTETNPSNIMNVDGSDLGSTNKWLIAPIHTPPPAPSGTWTFVRKNLYEPKRANVVVYNWDDAKTVSVDLSDVLQSGDQFVIVDAQNFYGDPVVSGTFDGSAVTIPMTGTAISEPVTYPDDLVKPAHSSLEFGTFILLPSSGSLSSVGQGRGVALQYSVAQNYPNPFNPTTTIRFTLPKASETRLDVYNLLGEKVRTLFEGHAGAGEYTVQFSGEGLPSGVYIYSLTAGSFVQVKKMLLVK